MVTQRSMPPLERILQAAGEARRLGEDGIAQVLDQCATARAKETLFVIYYEPKQRGGRQERLAFASLGEDERLAVAAVAREYRLTEPGRWYVEPAKDKTFRVGSRFVAGRSRHPDLAPFYIETETRAQGETLADHGRPPVPHPGSRPLPGSDHDRDLVHQPHLSPHFSFALSCCP